MGRDWVTIADDAIAQMIERPRFECEIRTGQAVPNTDGPFGPATDAVSGRPAPADARQPGRRFKLPAATAPAAYVPAGPLRKLA